MPEPLLAPALSALTLALVLAPLAPAAASPGKDGPTLSTQQVTDQAPPEVTDRMIVKYKTEAPAAEVERQSQLDADFHTFIDVDAFGSSPSPGHVGPAGFVIEDHITNNHSDGTSAMPAVDFNDAGEFDLAGYAATLGLDFGEQTLS